MLPTPRWVGNKWTLDLRGFGFGRHLLDAPPPPAGEVSAVHAAYELLARLRVRKPVGPQLVLPGTEGLTLAEVLRRYTGERSYRRSRRWCVETAARVSAELGHLPLAALIPPEGTRELFAWRDRVRAEGYDRRYHSGRVHHVTVGPRAMLDRLQVLRMALTWASEPPRMWLPALPTFPDARRDEREKIHRALTAWVDEATFRAVRDVIYLGGMGTATLEARWRREGLPYPGCTLDDYIARRRLWLSFAMYTGMRHQDLDCLDDMSTSPDFGCYWRWGRKTSTEEGLPEDMPKPLLADLEFERGRLGRPYRPGELIAGGPWKRVTRVLRAACARVGVPPFDVMTLRRSFCYHKAMSGRCEEGDLVRLMGHVDSKMIRTAYLQFPPASKRNSAGSAWPEMRTLRPGMGSARILPIRAALAHLAPTEGAPSATSLPKSARKRRPSA
jgi:hypothetical protein